MIFIDCAPKLDHILNDTLNLDFSTFEYETKYINDINSTADVTEENKTNISHKEKIFKSNNQTNTTQLNKNLKSNIELEITKPDNETTKSMTKAQNLIILSEENDISDTDSSLDWLGPVFINDTEITKSNRTVERTFQEKKDCNKCAELAQSDTKIEKSQTKEQGLNEGSEIELLYDVTIKSEATSKREIPTSQDFLMKLLRSVSGIPPEEIGAQKIMIDGYDYNINICRYLGPTYLCGYNKNIGEPKDPVEIEDIGNGCIIRGDRMECGYKVGPWNLKSKLSMKHYEVGNKTSPKDLTQTGQSTNAVNPAISPGGKLDTSIHFTNSPDQVAESG